MHRAGKIVGAGPFGVEHARHGNVVWGVVPMLALGAALGAPLASWAAQVLPHEWLVRAFAVFLLITAANTWVRAAVVRPRPTDGVLPPGR